MSVEKWLFAKKAGSHSILVLLRMGGRLDSAILETAKILNSTTINIPIAAVELNQAIDPFETFDFLQNSQ